MNKKRDLSIIYILILGLVLRLISLNQSFWLDEATSATLARDFSFSEIITRFSPGDFHPPLYYLVLKAWTIPFGVSEISARLLSVLFGLLTIYFVYLVVLRVTSHESRVTATLSALLMATAPLHIYYSQEARMYSMETFLVSLSFFSFVKIIKEARLPARQGRVGQWILFGLSLALIGLTDYLPLLIIPVFWIAGIYYRKNTVWWVKFLASHIILVAGAALWLPVFLKQIAGGIAVSTSLPAWWSLLGQISLNSAALVPVKFMIGRVGLENKLLYGLMVAGLGSLFGYLLFRSRSFLIWLWLTIPIVLAGLVGLKIPVFSYFRLIFVLPAFYLLTAMGLMKLKENLFMPFLALVFLVNLTFSAAYLLNPKFQRENWRGLVNFVEEKKKDKNAVTLFPANSQMEAYKFYSSDAKIGGPGAFSEDFEEIWLMRYVQKIFDPEDKLRMRIEGAGYKKENEHDFNGVVVWEYKR